MILIALGANIPSHAGVPDLTLRAALLSLAENGARPLAISHFYKTPAWPDPRDPEFVNAAAAIETELSPAKLMELLHATEAAFGRERTLKNAPRTLDLDILDYNGRVEQGPPVLPHPGIESRAFVLIPLCDVAPDWTHPVSGISLEELLGRILDTDRASVVRSG